MARSSAPANTKSARELLRDCFPGFSSTGKLIRGRKSCAVFGDYHGTRAVAKWLTRPDQIWRYYFKREAALYELFQIENPPVLAPRLLAVNHDAMVMIITQLDGKSLSMQRSCAIKPSDALAHALCDLVDRLSTWQRGLELIDRDPPSASITRIMRTRLLEDPNAPTQWMTDGAARCVRWGLIDEASLALITQALSSTTRVVFGHGDLLPRNLLCDGDTVSLVDWECAGEYVEDWDRALLWVAMPALRDALEARAKEQSAARRAGFLGAVAFAVLRELRFLQHFRVESSSARATRLRQDLQHTLTRLKLG